MKELEGFPPFLIALFEPVNRTELYQLCKQAGIEVPTGKTRGFYARALLIGRQASVQDPDSLPINSWRVAISTFVKQHWRELQGLITCPIGSGDFRSCWDCLDTQVLACVQTNHANRAELVTLRKK